MAVYLIAPLKDTVISDDLRSRIVEQIPDDKYRYFSDEDNICFVRYDGISKDLRQALDLAGSNPIPAIIVNISNGYYNGYGPADLWEWLKVNS